MDKEKIEFDPNAPYAHYDTCHKIYLDYRSSVSFGTVTAIISLIVGFLCVKFNASFMAVFFFIAVPFTMLSVIGCQAKRPKMCFIAVPMASVSAIVILISNSAYAFIGFILYVLAAWACFQASRNISAFLDLKDLPGFPLFNQAFENISFASMTELDVEEFIDESVLHEEINAKRFIAPIEPSEDMETITTDNIEFKEIEEQLPDYERTVATEINSVPTELRDEVAMSLGHLAPNLAEYEKTIAEEREANSDHIYEKMLKIQQGKNNDDISDVDLFG